MSAPTAAEYLELVKAATAAFESAPAAPPATKTDIAPAAVAVAVAEPVVESVQTNTVEAPKKMCLPEIPDMKMSEDEEPKAGRYIKFVLYDANNPQHREQFIRRIEWDGNYFIQGNVKNEAEIDAYWTQNGKLPHGVVHRGEGIGDAHFPAPNSTEPRDVQWLFQARALRENADYDDAVYAEWPDLMPCAGELKTV